jgi:hypothetical protein
MFGPMMKPTILAPQGLVNTDDLNERVLEAAANASNDAVAPESTPGNANITTWDESAGNAGRRVTPSPTENDETIAEQLVDAGNDEAGQEQRLSDAHENAADAQR